MSRYEHFLSPCAPGSFPARVMFLAIASRREPTGADCVVQDDELTGWTMATMSGSSGTYGRVKIWSGNDGESLWSGMDRWMKSPSRPWLISCQALRAVTLLGIWDSIESGAWTVAGSDYRSPQAPRGRWGNKGEGYIVIEDPPTVLQLRHAALGGVLQVVDAANYGIDRPATVTDDEAWVQEMARWYREACRVLIRGLMGGWRATAGSQASHSWRAKHLTHTVLCHQHARALQLESAAYYGGRCECFKIGKVQGPLWHLDYRSLYPWCAQTDRLPVRLLYYSDVGEDILRSDLPADAAVIADVTVDTQRPIVPLRQRGQTYWPLGRFRTQVCGPELVELNTFARVVKVHSWAMYQCAPALAAYMQAWYQVRCDADESGDRLLSAWAKRVMVALVGKLGQRDYQWTHYEKGIADHPWELWIGTTEEGEPCRYRSLDWTVQRETVLPYGADAVPAMAAWITSLGRVRLYAALRAAGRGHVYYCDTDSVIVSDEGCARLQRAGFIRPGEWGYLQVAGSHDRGEFFGIKHYSLDGILKCSGCPSSPDSVGADGKGRWLHVHLKGQLRKGEAPVARRVLRTYTRTDHYPLGRVLRSGRVVPFIEGG